jgi:hypothetical protein
VGEGKKGRETGGPHRGKMDISQFGLTPLALNPSKMAHR